MWANEQEAASLCGLSVEIFRKRRLLLEKAGFPSVTPWNGMRFIPKIEQFCSSNVDSALFSPLESTPLDIRNFEDGR